MRAAAFGLLAMVAGCSGCSLLVKTQPPSPAHRVRILWVHDSVMAKMQTAANDSVESMWQVTTVGVGAICPENSFGDLSCRYGTPLDSGYLVLGVIECPVKEATTFLIRASCPNPFAPTIHVHPHVGSGFGHSGNNCSPSPPDYAFQLVGRHLFDAILCGSNTRPTPYWFWNNPLLGTQAFPDTLHPVVGATGVLQ